MYYYYKFLRNFKVCEQKLDYLFVEENIIQEELVIILVRIILHTDDITMVQLCTTGASTHKYNSRSVCLLKRKTKVFTDPCVRTRC